MREHQDFDENEPGETVRRFAVLAVVFALAFPALASARIVIGRGMFGINLGQTMNQVRHKLGKPGRIDTGASWQARCLSPSPADTRYCRLGPTTTPVDPNAQVWYYPRRYLLVVFRRKRHLLRDLITGNRKERTANGLGVGSSESDVKRLVRGVLCSTGICGVELLVTKPRLERFETFFQFFGANQRRVSAVAISVYP